MKIKGVLFDLDGTLLDSMWVWNQVDIDFLGARGFSVPEDYQKVISAMGFRETAEYTIRRFELPEKPEDIIQEWNDMAEQMYHDQVMIKPFVRETLEYLKGRGLLLGIATSSYATLFEECLKRNGIYEYFDAVTETKEVSRGKEFPDIYIRAAEKLGCQPEECAVFEDIHKAVLAAKAGGFYTVGVYDEKSADMWEQIQSDSDCAIEGFQSLLEQPDRMEAIFEKRIWNTNESSL